MRRTAVVLLLALGCGAAAVWLTRAAPPLPPARTGSPVPSAGAEPSAGTAAATAGVRAAQASARDASTVVAAVSPPPREAVARPTVTASAAGDALLARAATDPGLTLAIAEVLAVGPIARTDTTDGSLEHQGVRLRVLADTGDPVLRRWQIVDVPLCPARSRELHGCHTPFDALLVGDVRRFVLARGRPDLGVLSPLFAQHTRWLVLAGPTVERPDDPVLARVPAALADQLGRPMTNVFRGRVAAVRASGAGAAGAARGLVDEFRALDVDVLEIAHLGGRLPLPKRVRIAPQPFVPGDELAGLEVGGEHWFATDDSGLFQSLRAHAPVAR